MGILDLNPEHLGFRAEELPQIDPAVIDQRVPLELDGCYRKISTIPDYPNFYLRWIPGHKPFLSLEEGGQQAVWRQQIQNANRHFRLMEECGIRVPPQRHIAVSGEAGRTSLLYTVVPRYEDLVTLDASKSDYAPAVARWISSLARFTERCIGDKLPDILYDLYKVEQYSLDLEGELLLHDTEIRLNPLALEPSPTCGAGRHRLALLATKTERALRRNHDFIEAERLYAASVGTTCMHHVSAETLMPAGRTHLKRQINDT